MSKQTRGASFLTPPWRHRASSPSVIFAPRSGGYRQPFELKSKFPHFLPTSTLKSCQDGQKKVALDWYQLHRQ